MLASDLCLITDNKCTMGYTEDCCLIEALPRYSNLFPLLSIERQHDVNNCLAKITHYQKFIAEEFVNKPISELQKQNGKVMFIERNFHFWC